MNCEMAEDNLSAYLDDMLDPPDRADIQVHLDGCVRCREVLDDYRRYDTLLAHLPRVAPPDDLRARIFESPEYLAIVREQQRDQQRMGRRRAIAPPGWQKIALQAAAVFVLVVGAALLIKQGLFSSGHPTGSVSISTIGNPGSSGSPLAAGNRLVFARADALWSAPETGPALAQQLTPHGITVAGFAVAPDGRHAAYVDGIHGDLHVIRSDGQRDTTIVQGHGLQILGAPVWSPDGQQLAYVANSPDGPALHLINSSGTNDRVIAASSGGLVVSFGHMIWSPDGLRVAWVQTASGAESLWSYDLVAHAARQVAKQADPAAAGAHFGDLHWLPDPLHPALTWAADTVSSPAANSAPAVSVTSGVFTLALSSSSVQRLTASGATYSGRLFTAAHGDGAWLLISAGSTATLEAIAADSGAVFGATSVPASVGIGIWSPDGTSVAYVTSARDLVRWMPTSGATQHLLSGATGYPAWSLDGSHLAVATSGGVVSVAVGAGNSASTIHLTAAPTQGPVATIWAPDGRAVVVISPSGVVIVTSDGTQSRVIEQGLLTGTPLEWSAAG